MDKTVFILGAGFSKDLNSPLQSELIKEIFNINNTAFMSDKFFEYRDIFTFFLRNELFFKKSDFANIALEDIYTPIDRCIIDNCSYRNLNKIELIKLRHKINALIVMMLEYKLRDIPDNNYADRFAEYIVNRKKIFTQQDDPLSIISLNWDIVMDNALYRKIDQDTVLDYCCYVSAYDINDNIFPGSFARGKNMYNIKILKLHGSMNWLQCQRCQRLFVKFFEKIAMDEFILSPTCRFCDDNFVNDNSFGNNSPLVSQLIMPTFLKDLNNVQLKLIWQNAGIELSEASKIVFMGYSFPAADFEMRQLLSRFVRHSAEIEVVLKNKPSGKESDYPEIRYRNFFGKRKMNFKYEGAEKYINEIILN